MNNPSKGQGRVIAIAGNQPTTLDILDALLNAGYEIRYLINMGPEAATSIAWYVDFSADAEQRGVPLLRPNTYAMKDQRTIDLFKRIRIDVLISVGWQRLFPRWFLDHLMIGAFGMHGSAEGLPRGRGRSPMNWSILENRDRFFTSLFRYDEGVDSGMIVGTQRFDIHARDTIRSLQHKNALAQELLLLKHLPSLVRGDARLSPQPSDVKPTYYPKRRPEDGVIDWREPVQRIDSLVRAVTRPYPGAFTWDYDTRIAIWQGALFDTSLNFDQTRPGQIVAAFHDQTFVVQCGDHPYYVTDWEAPQGWQPERGMNFRSVHNASWEMLEMMHGDA